MDDVLCFYVKFKEWIFYQDLFSITLQKYVDRQLGECSAQYN